MSERDDKTTSGRVLRCDEWEDLIADALDGTLAAADAAAFTRHHSECALCAQMFKETQQGRAWMEYLAVEPEVPSELLKKILARTSEQPAMGIAMPALTVPARPARYRVALPYLRQVARQVLEPRLMMTIAMAFFSIALTLNLTGINLAQIRPADLQPSRLRATLTRQYYATNEQVTKYYENLRLVYEMEARVRELRHSTEAVPASVQSPQPNGTPRQPVRDGSGSPSSTAPTEGLPGGHSHLKGDAVPPAMMVHALPPRFYTSPAAQERPQQVPASFDRKTRTGKVVREVFRALPPTTEDQAKRSLV
jgi:Putative zinc-finger